MSNKKIGIFGGTFDPPHLGHLILNEQIKNNFGLDKIIFMPAGNPPHKKDKEIISDNQRLEMIRLATANNPFFEISNWELSRDRYSYTAYTLKEFVPSLDAEQVFFIIGADSLADIFKWHKPDYLLAEGKFIVFNRPGYNLDDILGKPEYEPYLDNINTYQSLHIEISSSYIREEIKKGNSIRYLTPENVRKYIMGKKLYR
ncbi:MAG: nicotinate-nucleotide adenylyltransferase [Halanaerobium sp.]